MSKEEDKSFNIKSTTLEKGIDLAKEFLQSLIKPSIDELGLLISERIKSWRLKNQIDVLIKAKKIIENKGLKIKEVPLKILCPLLEGASFEEEDSLKNKWASLLASYVNKENNIDTPLFVSILNQISSVEATFLDFLTKKDSLKSSLNKDELIKKTGIKEFQLENLARLNLVTDQRRRLSSIHFITTSPRNFFYLTSLGEEFVKMCAL